MFFLSRKSINFSYFLYLVSLAKKNKKDGETFSSAPARRLSQSFNLNIVGGTAITPKQTLLTAILDVMETHTPFKRSPESHFKAFLSRALNEGKLSSWLRLIFKSRTLVLDFYEPWSYTAVTGNTSANDLVHNLVNNSRSTYVSFFTLNLSYYEALFKQVNDLLCCISVDKQGSMTP